MMHDSLQCRLFQTGIINAPLAREGKPTQQGILQRLNRYLGIPVRPILKRELTVPTFNTLYLQLRMVSYESPSFS
jgi:hypothetical protein